MQHTSDIWKGLLRRQADREWKLVIAGAEYVMGPKSALKLSNSLMSKLEIGCANAGQIDFSLFPAGEIPRGSKIEAWVRLRDGAEVSEWLRAGTYFFSTRDVDYVTGVMTVHGFDAMLKAEGTFLDGVFEGYRWPMPAEEAAAWIGERIGARLDPRSGINPDYRIPCPIQVDEKGNESGSFLTSRDVLQWIATASGGNWTVTPAGRLLLVGLASQPAPTAYLVDEYGAPLVFGDTRILIGDADPAGRTGGMGETYLGTRAEGFQPGLEYRPITGVALTGGEEGLTYLAGHDAGFVLEANQPDATQAMAEHVLDRVRGYVWRVYKGSTALLDPAAELGDGIHIGGLYSVIASIDREGVLNGVADISAPGSGSEEDEYPYIPKAERALRRVEDRVEELGEDLSDLEERVDELWDALDHDDDDDPVPDIEGLFEDVEDLKEQLENLEQGGGCECDGHEHPQTDELDFSGWYSNRFTETLDSGDEVEYTMSRDGSGRPVSITQGDTGHTMEVVWP